MALSFLVCRLNVSLGFTHSTIDGRFNRYLYHFRNLYFFLLLFFRGHGLWCPVTTHGKDESENKYRGRPFHAPSPRLLLTCSCLPVPSKLGSDSNFPTCPSPGVGPPPA